MRVGWDLAVVKLFLKKPSVDQSTQGNFRQFSMFRDNVIVQVATNLLMISFDETGYLEPLYSIFSLVWGLKWHCCIEG